ncbi:AbrB/MazE/SpoVT family DNA-binding domain-containing protein [Alicyclobacillus tolerans]|nr:AbrB/MazE/SpoVT family DNA-binding domain-containing protein [Alicyclobacillus tolerans]
MLYVDECGAIQIPDDIRDWLGIKPDDTVELCVEEGSLVIRCVHEPR